MNQIQGKVMHGVQKHEPDSGDIYALGAETRLRFEAKLCTEGRDPPQTQGTFMHGVQKPAPSSGLIYARCA